MRINLNRLKKADILWLASHKCHCQSPHYYIEHQNCFLQENPKDSPVHEEIGFLDIEASNLQATFGIVLSYCIKRLDGEILKRVVTPKELRKGIYDRELMEQCIGDIKKFDRIVVYYGTDHRFDIPFLRTRAVYYNLDFPLYKEVKVTDVYPIIRNKFKLHRNRLETACEFFGIPSKEHRLDPAIWFKAISGDNKQLGYILTHNEEDVVSLEALYKKVIGYASNTQTSI